MKKNEARKKSTALVKSDGNGVEKSYGAWIADLKRRYRATQIKAAVAVNSALIEFYWNLGKDVREKYVGTKIYGTGFFPRLSIDLKESIPDAEGFSTQNLRYCLHFYELYSVLPNFQQLVGKLVNVPWGHHCTIIDKCKNDPDKALFYVLRTLQNGWSRNSLLNWLSTDLYEREGKAQTNFELTMPSDDCDLSRQICSALAFARHGALESCAPLARRLRVRASARSRGETRWPQCQGIATPQERRKIFVF